MSKTCSGFLQLAYFVYARSESPGEVMRTCRLVRAFATGGCNKNSCADQFIVLKLHCGPLFYFHIQYYNLNS